MCYSAMVRKDIERIARQFGAKVDMESFKALYQMRAKDPELKIPSGMDEFFLGQSGASAKAIKSEIADFQKQEIKRVRAEIEEATAELEELEAKQKKKPTKTCEKAIGVKQRKIEKLLSTEKRLSGRGSTSKSDGYRIYPGYFAPVIVVDGKSRIIQPMRYRILPATGVEIPTKYNVFNARRDSLTDARTWKAIFGKKHAIFPFVKFFEWVEDKKGRKHELFFEPEGFEDMWAASLFEECKRDKVGLIRSFAMVTDDPPPEVAEAGHDRCPVFLDDSYMDIWLNPKGKKLEELDELLDHKQKTYYAHQIAA